MNRRNFLSRCGFAAAGTVLLSALAPGGSLEAVGLTALSNAQLTPGDRVLLRRLSVYGTDVYFWGSRVFARATGIKVENGTTNLLVRVDDLHRLGQFLESKQLKKMDVVRADGNTLRFTFRGTPYTVTNEIAGDFALAVSRGGVTREGSRAGALFIHETVMYHPATDTLSDPHLAVNTRHIDLAELPTGGLKARFQTLVDGWLASHRLGLKLGKTFRKFQDELLASQPTAKAANRVVAALLENIAALSDEYDLNTLRPLLLSPLVSGSILAELGVDVTAAIAEIEKLHAAYSTADYADAALWLTVLLEKQIEDGTAGEWLDLVAGDAQVSAANRAALSAAGQLVQARASGVR